MARRNEPTKEQVEAAAGFLRDNLHLFGPRACFLETGHIDEIAYGMLRAAGKGRALSRAGITAENLFEFAQAAGIRLTITVESAFNDGKHQGEETA